MSSSTPLTYDVVVVGSGAGGLSTAIAAAHGGASVLVVEKADTCGGATAWSGGWMWTPRNMFAIADGVVEDRSARGRIWRTDSATTSTPPRSMHSSTAPGDGRVLRTHDCSEVRARSQDRRYSR